jgi:hypothetical protein
MQRFVSLFVEYHPAPMITRSAADGWDSFTVDGSMVSLNHDLFSDKIPMPNGVSVHYGGRQVPSQDWASQLLITSPSPTTPPSVHVLSPKAFARSEALAMYRQRAIKMKKTRRTNRTANGVQVSGGNVIGPHLMSSHVFYLQHILNALKFYGVEEMPFRINTSTLAFANKTFHFVSEVVAEHIRGGSWGDGDFLIPFNYFPSVFVLCYLHNTGEIDLSGRWEDIRECCEQGGDISFLFHDIMSDDSNGLSNGTFVCEDDQVIYFPIMRFFFEAKSPKREWTKITCDNEKIVLRVMDSEAPEKVTLMGIVGHEDAGIKSGAFHLVSQYSHYDKKWEHPSTDHCYGYYCRDAPLVAEPDLYAMTPTRDEPVPATYHPDLASFFADALRQIIAGIKSVAKGDDYLEGKMVPDWTHYTMFSSEFSPNGETRFNRESEHAALELAIAVMTLWVIHKQEKDLKASLKNIYVCNTVSAARKMLGVSCSAILGENLYSQTLGAIPKINLFAQLVDGEAFCSAFAVANGVLQTGEIHCFSSTADISFWSTMRGWESPVITHGDYQSLLLSAVARWYDVIIVPDSMPVEYRSEAKALMDEWKIPGGSREQEKVAKALYQFNRRDPQARNHASPNKLKQLSSLIRSFLRPDAHDPLMKTKSKPKVVVSPQSKTVVRSGGFNPADWSTFDTIERKGSDPSTNHYPGRRINRVETPTRGGVTVRRARRGDMTKGRAAYLQRRAKRRGGRGRK